MQKCITGEKRNSMMLYQGGVCMAFTHEEEQKIRKSLDTYIERIRPPVQIRDKVDIAYTLEGQCVEIFEIRQTMDKKTIQSPVAKTIFSRTTNMWKIFWQRSDLKWHGYEPKKEVSSIDKFIKIVEEDKLCCFWG